MENSSCVPSGVPRVNSENEAGADRVVDRLGRAIFIGCVATMARLSWSPKTSSGAGDDHRPRPNFRAGPHGVEVLVARRCQAPR